jgi:Glutamine amidotransferases class-II
LLGRDYCFAHNGTLEGVFKEMHLGRFRPVGSTDSEHLFCHILGELDGAGSSLATLESWRWLHAKLIVANDLGELNCMLSDGERLFCYHDVAGYKGLHMCRVAPAEDRGNIDGEVLSVGGPIAGYLIATRPSSEWAWEAFHPGELIVFEAGEVIFSRQHSKGNREVHKAKPSAMGKCGYRAPPTACRAPAQIPPPQLFPPRRRSRPRAAPPPPPTPPRAAVARRRRAPPPRLPRAARPAAAPADALATALSQR